MILDVAQNPNAVDAAPSRPLRALLVDPSLFTGAYDAALSAGLAESGVSVRWATRAPRPEEECELPANLIEPVYYRGAEASAKTAGKALQLRKGLSHFASIIRLIRLRDRLNPDIVHFQWAVLPFADVLAIRHLRRRTPVVVTVHDTIPFNGIPTSRLQLLGYGDLLRAADHLIVHTRQGRAALLGLGCLRQRISVVPHGPLQLRAHAARSAPRPRSDARWTFVLFGKLQPYKGADLLINALAALDGATRARLRVIIAGEPLMDLTALRDLIARPDLRDCVDLRPYRLSEAEMQELFDEADAFVFPYRQIEASGVYHLIKGLGKWIVAADLGSFSEELTPDRGTLIAPENTGALVDALAGAIGRRPAPSVAPDIGWTEIGRRLRNLYAGLIAARQGPRT